MEHIYTYTWGSNRMQPVWRWNTDGMHVGHVGHTGMQMWDIQEMHMECNGNKIKWTANEK